MDRFGPPLAPTKHVGASTRQYFTKALLELRSDQADMPLLVRPAPLGRAATAGLAFPQVRERPGARFFPATGHTLREAFLVYWDQSDGEELFGEPLSEEVEAFTADGRRDFQYFERAVFSDDPRAGVRLEPLGWEMLVRQRLRASTALQIR
jgi:hypothetical protein